MSDFSKARIDMVEGQLRTSGVFDPRVLSAFAKIPREAFLSAGQVPFAYADLDHKLSSDPLRYMGAPAPLAKLIELGAPGPEDVVLDVACATGYTSAVLAQLASSVVGVESDGDLVNRADEILAQLDIPNAAVIKGKPEEGAPSEAPFDVIIIGAAIDEVPKKLLEQLRDGGKLVALIGTGASARAVTFTRSEAGIAQVSAFNACLPRIAEFSKPHQFSL
ncbi:MAG: protein-L-isoaspartate O-methyltransferase [Devosiaceae bacterium]|nr:protein-L-isoaspartate O-methyltransferase [Devosiaceae bacterium]